MSRIGLTSEMKAIIKMSLMVLGLAAIAPVSPVQAEDQRLQQAAFQVEPTVETGRVLNLDISSVSLQSDDWYSDADGHSTARQARIETCYLTAQAAYQGGVWDEGFGSHGKSLHSFDQSVSSFYAGQRKKSQFGDCTR